MTDEEKLAAQIIAEVPRCEPNADSEPMMEVDPDGVWLHEADVLRAVARYLSAARLGLTLRAREATVVEAALRAEGRAFEADRIRNLRRSAQASHVANKDLVRRMRDAGVR